MKNKNNHIAPPRLAERLLAWFLKPELAEEVEGDLEEKFLLSLEKHSVRKARRNYWFQVLNYLRPFALKKRRSKNNFNLMFKHNLLISYRSFLRFKSTFLINLTGLASGLACTLLIYLWVSDELQIDRFHENEAQLYEVKQHNRWTDEVTTHNHTPHPLGPTFAEEFPEVAMHTTVTEDWAESPGIVSLGEKKFKAHDFEVDNNFFKAFSYELLQGDPDLPLPNTKSVLISDELAGKLFKSINNAVGKTIEWQQEDMSGLYNITGIFKKPRKTSSRQFDILLNRELMVERIDDYSNWANNNDVTYLIMNEGADIDAFNAKIENYLKTKNDWARNTLSIQRYADGYLYGTFKNGIQAGGRIEYVRLFSIVGMFILVIACINFMNLTTAKASNRTKEIGVKKAIGALRKHLAWQYLSEAILLSMMGLTIAIILVVVLLPEFNRIAGKELTFSLEPGVLAATLLIALLTGLISGSYPALYLSSLNPMTMLRSKLNMAYGDKWLRKGLVIFQFCISAVLVIAVMVVSQQIDYVQSKQLGFNRDNLVRFDYVTEADNDYLTFITELKRIPGVLEASGSVDDATGVHGGTSYISWPGKDPKSQQHFQIMEVGYDFIETMGIELAAGRSFERDRDQPGPSKMLFNEAGIKAMGLEDPVGKTVTVKGRKTQIIGVVKDFHFESMYNAINPLYMELYDELEYTLVRIQAGTEIQTLEAMEKVYLEYLPGVPFEPRFVDDDVQSMYQSEKSIAVLSRYSAGIAIIISCMGLLGLTSFTAERRTKEIGIRKVLGAGAWNIVYLLSSSFTGLVILAMIISLPVSYWVASSWLQGFAFSIDLNLWHFLLAGILMLLFSWLVAGIQTMKAANANPVNSLRNE